MKEILDFLAANKTFFLATTGVDGAPKVRPFGLVIEDGGKLYLCTSNRKSVYGELMADPRLELCACAPTGQWLRLRGKAVFSGDLAVKAKVLDASPGVKGIYQSADNPIFEIFYLAEATGAFFDFSGNPPREIAL